MRGFTSEYEFKRYAYLFTLSLLLSGGKEFWFCGELYQACESKDYDKLRKLLIKLDSSVWIFADSIDWEEVTRSALVIHEFGNNEHSFLLERLDLLKGDSGRSANCESSKGVKADE